MLKKSFIIISILFLLTGCSCKTTKEEISFSSWGSITEVNILKKIIADFESENPNIKVNLMHIPQNYFQKLHLLFASNTPPDVIFINNLYLPIYYEHLEDLSKEVNSADFFSQTIEGLSINSKLYAIPRDISNLVFYINTTQLPNPVPNWSIEDLLEYTKIAKTKYPYGISFEEDLFWLQPYLSYYNEIFNETFNAENSQGLKFYRELRDKYNVAPTKSQIGSSTLAQMFLDEKLAIYLSGRWMYPKICDAAKFPWIVAPFPQDKGFLPCDTSGWAIPKYSKHKVAAKSFIKFLSSEKSAQYFLNTKLIVPARVNIANNLINTEHNESVFIEIIRKSKPTPVCNNYKQLVDKFNSTKF